MTEEQNKQASTEQEVVEEIQEPSELEVFEKENSELKDKILRSAAELENLRKRHTKEVADANIKNIIKNIWEQII